jgi:hypothetical protein
VSSGYRRSPGPKARFSDHGERRFDVLAAGFCHAGIEEGARAALSVADDTPASTAPSSAFCMLALSAKPRP